MTFLNGNCFSKKSYITKNTSFDFIVDNNHQLPDRRRFLFLKCMIYFSHDFVVIYSNNNLLDFHIINFSRFITFILAIYFIIAPFEYSSDRKNNVCVYFHILPKLPLLMFCYLNPITKLKICLTIV
jgi:hypothetical protein